MHPAETKLRAELSKFEPHEVHGIHKNFNKSKGLAEPAETTPDLLIEDVKSVFGGVVPKDGGDPPKPCCPAGSCGVCIGGACVHC